MLDAARAAAAGWGVRHDPFFLDVNSVPPGTKREVASVVEQAGQRYVDAAVMTSVARTVREAGIEPILSASTAVRQDWSSELGRDLPPEVLAEGALETLLDAILALSKVQGKADAA